MKENLISGNALRKIFGLVKGKTKYWRIRTNTELRNLYEETDLVEIIKVLKGSRAWRCAEDGR